MAKFPNVKEASVRISNPDRPMYTQILRCRSA